MSEHGEVVRVELDFSGTGLQLLGWGLLYILLSVLVLPAAWGAVPLYAWFFRNIRPADGAAVEFLGRPSEIWVLFAATMFLSYLPQIGGEFADGNKAKALTFLLALLLLPRTAALGLAILRWAVMNIHLENGPPLAFAGSYGGFLGWKVLIILSVFTVFGWAWALTGFARWLCGNVEAEDLIVSFEGKGLSLLWRGFAACVLPFLPLWIIPLSLDGLREGQGPGFALVVIFFPLLLTALASAWTARWLIAWFVRNTYLYRRTA